MTNRELIHLIDCPECLDEDTLPAVAHLVENFPYFQTARLLYLMNLWAVKDSAFASELKKAAFYVGDRKALFFKLEGESFASIINVLQDNTLMKDSFDLIDSFLLKVGDVSPQLPTDTTVVSAPASSYELEEIPVEVTSSSASMKYQEIIDRFLKKDKEGRMKIRFNENQPLSVGSSINEDTQDASPFFSETLANIYIKQEKYDKAIEIIRKLILLYPEKSVYFADQIRFLEKMIINVKK